MTRWYGIIAFFLVVLAWDAGVARSAIPRSDPFAVTWGSQKFVVAPGDRFETSITVNVPSGNYLNADELELEFVTLEGIHIDDVRFPPTQDEPETTTAAERRIYSGSVTIAIEGHVPETLSLGTRELTARVSFRGCTPEVCFRPRSEEMMLPLDVVAVRDFTTILDQGLLWTILIVFVAGLLTFLTPYVWLILPVVFYVGTLVRNDLRVVVPDTTVIEENMREAPRRAGAPDDVREREEGVE
jgi:hypothetical protein